MSNIRFNSEKDLEDALMKHMDDSGLCFMRNEEVCNHWRQVDMGAYGIADIVTVSAHEGVIYDITVIELKNTEIQTKDIKQTLRYMTGIKDYLHEIYPSLCNEVEVFGILLGSGYSSDNDNCYLINHISNFSLYTFDLSIANGLIINLYGNKWTKTEPNFKANKSLIKELKVSLIEQRKEFKEFLEYHKLKSVK